MENIFLYHELESSFNSFQFVCAISDMVYGTMIDDKTVLISESTKEIIPNILFGNNGHENNHMSN